MPATIKFEGEIIRTIDPNQESSDYTKDNKPVTLRGTELGLVVWNGKTNRYIAPSDGIIYSLDDGYSAEPTPLPQVNDPLLEPML